MPKHCFSLLFLLVPHLAIHATLVPTEIMYHAEGKDEYDFIEFHNAGDTPIEMGGATFSEGVEFTFQPYTLSPGDYMVIVRDAAHFQARYQTESSPYYKEGNETLYVAGVWNLELSNAGETLTLKDAAGVTIFSFTYDDENGWPLEADGHGSSLELVDPAGYAAIPDQVTRDRFLGNPSNWQASAVFHGTPGSPGKAMKSVVINEILANTDLVTTDTVELYNPTSLYVDMTGWYISDSKSNYKKYRIPDNTRLAPGTFITFDETQFNPEGEWKNGSEAMTGPNDFSFSGSKGDNAYLTQTDKDGYIIAIIDSVSFGPTLSGGVIGHWPDGKGGLVPLSAFTPGSANTTPKIGPVIISEVMYHPNSLDENPLEFIEIFNTSESEQNLESWTLEDAVDFLFTKGTVLPSKSYLLVVGFDPSDPNLLSAFRTFYDIDDTLPILGPWAGSLNNSGDNILLKRRDIDGDLVPDPLTGLSNYPLVQEDHVPYEDSGNWPGRADGTGPSLSRKSYTSPGWDPDNWRSSNEFNGNPGAVGLPQRLVAINEVLTHTDLPLLDTIELFNPGDSAIDISGWYLSDTKEDELDIEQFRKFRIPNGTILSPGGFATFDQTQFNPNIDPATETGNPEPHHFGLSSYKKEDIALVSADDQGKLLRIVDLVQVGPTSKGITYGLWPDTEGNFYPMSERTLGSVNSHPGVGPVVITEIQYNPGDMDNANDLEFIEIYNIGTQTIRLGNDTETGGAWQIDGAVGYTFKLGHDLDPGSSFVLVGFDPADQAKLQAFLDHYSLTQAPQILGPWTGNLSNGGERIRIERPDYWEVPTDGSPAFFPMVTVETITYKDTSPWPLEADGLGSSLAKTTPANWGDTGEEWEARYPPTPGTVPYGPSISTTPVTLAYEGENYRYIIQAAYQDSPTPPAITATGLTSWLTLVDHGNGTAVLMGKPTSANLGFSFITIKATSQGVTAEQKFGITVKDALMDTDQDGAPDGVEYRLGADLADVASTPSRLSHEAAFLATCPQGVWVRLGWLGNYLDTLGGWVYHESLGWVYLPHSFTGPGHWIWDPHPETGWLWTERDTYPWMFNESKGWLYHNAGSTSPRLFYSDRDREWKEW